MKRTLFILLTIVCISVIFLQATCLAAETYGDITYNYSYITKTHGVYKCSTTAEEVEILSEINGVPVTYIDNQAFKDCINLKNVVIPSTINSIDYEAFYNCVSLTDINIPDGITDIPSSAFYNCTSFEEIR